MYFSSSRKMIQTVLVLLLFYGSSGMLFYNQCIEFIILEAREINTTQACCPKAFFDGQHYDLINPTDTALPFSCPSSCVYQLSGSNNDGDLSCFDTIENGSLCWAPTPPMQRRGYMVSAVEAENGTRHGKRSSTHCAYVYEHWYYGGQRGNIPLDSEWDYTNELTSYWNDQISSLSLKAGCRMRLYDHPCRTGAYADYYQDTPWVGRSWNDRFSSVICICG